MPSLPYRCLLIICLFTGFIMNNSMQSNLILGVEGKPSDNLLKLLELLEINYDGSLSSLVEVTQREWVQKIRPEGKERWQVAESVEDYYQSKAEELSLLLTTMGILETIAPKQEYYDYIVVLGANMTTLCKRFAYLFQLCKTVNFDQCVVLVGQRPLDSSHENPTILREIKNKNIISLKEWDEDELFPSHETGIAHFILKHAQMPQQLYAKKVTIVDTPMQTNDKGQEVRPNTGHTVQEWLKTDPKQGTALVISNQPFCAYQESVLKTLLPSGFVIETVGKCEPEDHSMAVCLDSLARFLYQEHKRACA